MIDQCELVKREVYVDAEGEIWISLMASGECAACRWGYMEDLCCATCLETPLGETRFVRFRSELPKRS